MGRDATIKEQFKVNKPDGSMWLFRKLLKFFITMEFVPIRVKD